VNVILIANGWARLVEKVFVLQPTEKQADVSSKTSRREVAI